MPKPTRRQRLVVEEALQNAVVAAQEIPERHLKHFAPELQAAAKELSAKLAELKTKGAGKSYSAHQVRSALYQVESSLHELKSLHPKMEKLLKGAATEASLASINATASELSTLTTIFEGAVVPTDFDRALVWSRGRGMLWDRYKSSARRYSGAVGKALRREMAISVLKQDGLDGAVDRLMERMPEVFGKFRSRAERLVRTETMHAYNAMHHQSLLEANKEDPDGDLRMRWDASFDRRRCLECKDLDGRVVDLDKEFEARWGENKKSTNRHPPAHPNCRCVVVPWVDDWPDWDDKAGPMPKGGEPKPEKATKAELKKKPKKIAAPKPKSKPKPKPAPPPPAPPKPKPTKAQLAAEKKAAIKKAVQEAKAKGIPTSLDQMVKQGGSFYVPYSTGKPVYPKPESIAKKKAQLLQAKAKKKAESTKKKAAKVKKLTAAQKKAKAKKKPSPGSAAAKVEAQKAASKKKKFQFLSESIESQEEFTKAGKTLGDTLIDPHTGKPYYPGAIKIKQVYKAHGKPIPPEVAQAAEKEEAAAKAIKPVKSPPQPSPGAGLYDENDARRRAAGMQAHHDLLSDTRRKVANRELTSTEVKAVRSYTSSSYAINSKLRGEKGIDSPSIGRKVQAIDKAMRKSKTPRDVIVYRGERRSEADIAKLLEAGEYTHDGYTSTGVVKGFQGNLKMTIKVPEGSNAVYVGSGEFSHYASERELLLDRGARVKIISHKTVGGTTYVEGVLVETRLSELSKVGK